MTKPMGVQRASAVLGVAVIAASILEPCTASASDVLPVPPVGVVEAGVYGGSGAVGLGGLVTGLGTALTLTDRDPPTGWLVGSYVMGAVNIGMSALWLSTDLEAVGAAQLAIGVVNVALAIAATIKGSQPRFTRDLFVQRRAPVREQSGEVLPNHIRSLSLMPDADLGRLGLPFLTAASYAKVLDQRQ